MDYSSTFRKEGPLPLETVIRDFIKFVSIWTIFEFKAGCTRRDFSRPIFVDF